MRIVLFTALLLSGCKLFSTPDPKESSITSEAEPEGGNILCKIDSDCPDGMSCLSGVASSMCVAMTESFQWIPAKNDLLEIGGDDYLVTFLMFTLEGQAEKETAAPETATNTFKALFSTPQEKKMIDDYIANHSKNGDGIFSFVLYKGVAEYNRPWSFVAQPQADIPPSKEAPEACDNTPMWIEEDIKNKSGNFHFVEKDGSRLPAFCPWMYKPLKVVHGGKEIWRRPK